MVNSIALSSETPTTCAACRHIKPHRKKRLTQPWDKVRIVLGLRRNRWIYFAKAFAPGHDAVSSSQRSATHLVPKGWASHQDDRPMAIVKQVRVGRKFLHDAWPTRGLRRTGLRVA
jgi:hypothetical protein